MEIKMDGNKYGDGGHDGEKIKTEMNMDIM